MFFVGFLLFQLTEGYTTHYGATPSPMSNPGSRAMSIGFTVMLLSVSAGIMIHSGAGGFGLLLLCFTGVLAGANLVAVGVSMTDVPAAFGGARALGAFVIRWNTAAAVGLVMASCAVTVVSGETEPVLCIAMFTLLLLGVSLINVGARAE